jgi:hypothetical protein
MAMACAPAIATQESLRMSERRGFDDRTGGNREAGSVAAAAVTTFWIFGEMPIVRVWKLRIRTLEKISGVFGEKSERGCLFVGFEVTVVLLPPSYITFCKSKLY